MSYTVIPDDGLALLGTVKSEFEAFAWICSESRHDKVSHSQRYLAISFGWPRAKVRRFLDKLVAMGLLEKTGPQTGPDQATYRVVITKEFSVGIEKPAHKPAQRETLQTKTIKPKNVPNDWIPEKELWDKWCAAYGRSLCIDTLQEFTANTNYKYKNFNMGFVTWLKRSKERQNQ